MRTYSGQFLREIDVTIITFIPKPIPTKTPQNPKKTQNEY